MKLFIDFFPLAVFFLTFKVFTEQDFITATIALMVASVMQISFTWFKDKKIEKMHVIVLVLVLLFGSLTVLFDDPLFVKWKVTIVEWLFAAALLGSQFIGKQNFIERLFSQHFDAPRSVWLKVNLAWITFFTAMGFLNLYVAFNFSLDTWVDFKVIWLTVITFAFMIVQSLFLVKYFKEPEEQTTESSTPVKEDA